MSGCLGSLITGCLGLLINGSLRSRMSTCLGSVRKAMERRLEAEMTDGLFTDTMSGQEHLRVISSAIRPDTYTSSRHGPPTGGPAVQQTKTNDKRDLSQRLLDFSSLSCLVCVCLSACLLGCLSVCLPAWLFVCLLVCFLSASLLPACLSAYLPACLLVCLPAYSTCLFAYLPACLPACPCKSHTMYNASWIRW